VSHEADGYSSDLGHEQESVGRLDALRTQSAPPPARPDDKDWTWVLHRPCPDCGADVRRLSIKDVARANRANAERWRDVLSRDDEWLRTRPEPDIWSPLEYACHVRDVYRLFAERLTLMVTQDDPLFANWNPNETAEAKRYDLAEPRRVCVELTEAAEVLATAFERLPPEDALRNGRRSDGAAFTIETFARYGIHDPMHHLWDVTG